MRLIIEVGSGSRESNMCAIQEVLLFFPGLQFPEWTPHTAQLLPLVVSHTRGSPERGEEPRELLLLSQDSLGVAHPPNICRHVERPLFCLPLITQSSSQISRKFSLQKPRKRAGGTIPNPSSEKARGNGYVGELVLHRIK